MNVIADYDQFFRFNVTTYWIHFSQDRSSERSDTKMSFFRHTNQRKLILLETCLCLTSTISREIWEPVLPALLHNRHKLIFKRFYWWHHEIKFKLTSNKYHVTQNPSALMHLHDDDEAEGWWFPNCLHGRRDSAHSGDGKCIYHFNQLAQCRMTDLVSIIDYLWYVFVTWQKNEDTEKVSLWPEKCRPALKASVCGI